MCARAARREPNQHIDASPDGDPEAVQHRMCQPYRAGETFRLGAHACHVLQQLGGSRWNRLPERGAMSDPASIARYRAACQTASGCAARGRATIGPQTRLPGTGWVIIGEACWLRSLTSKIPAHLVCVQGRRPPSFSAATCAFRDDRRAFRISMSASRPPDRSLKVPAFLPDSCHLSGAEKPVRRSRQPIDVRTENDPSFRQFTHDFDEV